MNIHIKPLSITVTLLVTALLASCSYTNTKSRSYAVITTENVENAYQNAQKVAESAQNHMKKLMSDANGTLKVSAAKESKAEGMEIKLTCSITTKTKEKPDGDLVDACYEFVRVNWSV